MYPIMKYDVSYRNVGRFLPFNFISSTTFVVVDVVVVAVVVGIELFDVAVFSFCDGNE